MTLRSLDELRSLTEAHIEVEREIDTELRRRPIRDVTLEGPIPFAELAPVMRMPGKTLALWRLILHRVEFSKSMWVALPADVLKQWGVSQDAKIDALKRLERVGKIAIKRVKGGPLEVLLIWKPKT
jgi:hypothetical protein